jgi:hypothetical protein
MREGRAGVSAGPPVTAAAPVCSARGGALALHVEVIGPTSGGKTTLTRAIEKACRHRAIDATSGDDVVLRQMALQWAGGEFLRRRLIDVAALLTCLRGWHAHRELGALIWRASLRVPGGWTRKLNQARNALRKIGIFRLVERGRRHGQLVLVDNEGVLQGAHNLFVHATAEARDEDLAAFLSLAPLPDAIVCVEEEESVLLTRMLARGHRRVPAGSPEAAALFVRRAVRVFDVVVRQPEIRRRLVLVSADGSVRLAKEAEDDARLRALAELVEESVALLPTKSRPRAGGGA